MYKELITNLRTSGQFSESRKSLNLEPNTINLLLLSDHSRVNLSGFPYNDAGIYLQKDTANVKCRTLDFSQGNSRTTHGIIRDLATENGIKLNVIASLSIIYIKRVKKQRANYLLVGIAYQASLSVGSRRENESSFVF